jgi:hypothetical protein
MKRVLIVGNSHIGALKCGLNNKRIKQTIDRCEIEFDFAGTTGAIDMTCVDGKILVSEESPRFDDFLLTTNGKRSLSLDHYDHIFMVGLGSPLDPRRFIGDPLQPLSTSIIFAIVKQTVDHTFSPKYVYSSILKWHHQISYWIPNPCEPEKLNLQLRDDPDNVHRTLGRIPLMGKPCFFLSALESPNSREKLLVATIADRIRKATENQCEKMGLAGVILPPECMLRNHFQTKAHYSINAKHFCNQTLHREIDPHMNEAYGAEILEVLMRKLGCETATTKESLGNRGFSGR